MAQPKFFSDNPLGNWDHTQIEEAIVRAMALLLPCHKLSFVLSRPERQHEAGGRWRTGRSGSGATSSSWAGRWATRTRRGPLRAYCTGLILPGERKSVEPMAARVDPGRVQAAHQSLHHFVAKAEWSDEALLAVVRATVLPAIERQGPIRAWIIDDTGFPKKGRHSVGVARQYCGQVGKQDNCQIAVTLSVANAHASLPVACRLYLPEAWAQDPERRAKAGVPDEVAFRTKPEIALDEIRATLQAGVSPGVVLADAGYGVDTAFRTALTEMGLSYILGIQSSTTLWAPGTAPLPPKPWSGKGRPPTRIRRDPHHTPLSARDLAKTLPDEAWQIVTWREGTNAPLASRFAAVRVRPAHRDHLRHEPRPEEWFLVEWPNGEKEPTKYWLSTLPGTTRRLPTLSSRPSCAGASSGTTRTSSRRSGSVTTRGEAGGASTTMHRSASQLTDSSWPSAVAFPLEGSPGSGPPSGRPTTGLGARLIRPERHSPTSIATLRRRLALALMGGLPRCPCCLRAFRRPHRSINL